MSDIRVTFILCDFAQVEGGKLFVSGGGWSVTTTPTAICGLALVLEVPGATNKMPIDLTISLCDAAGELVLLNDNDDPRTVVLNGQLIIDPTEILNEDAPVVVPVALNVPPMNLVAERSYKWVLAINDERRAEWERAFYVMARSAQLG